jgi:hypothetical protein
MLFAFLVKKNQYEGTAPSYAWVARQAILTRSHWGQVDETTLLFEKSGEPVEIPDDSNLRSAIHTVIEIEYKHELSRLVPWECADMLRQAHFAADSYLARKSGN